VKKLLVFLILVALGLTGVAYYTKHTAGRSTEETYTTAKVEFGELRDLISSNATLKPRDVKPIFTVIPGRVVYLDGDNNQEIEEGQVLIRLDPVQARLKRDEAEGNLNLALVAVKQAELERDKAIAARDTAKSTLDKLKTYSKDTLGGLDLLKAEGMLEVQERTVKSAESAIAIANAKVKLAQSQLAEAEEGLKRTTIEVPRFQYAGDDGRKPAVGEVAFDAENKGGKRKFVVLDRKVELGQNVDTKEPLFILAAGLDDMEAHALIPEADISRISKGQQAEFWVKALGEENRMLAVVSERRLKPATTQGAIYYEVILNVQNRKDAKTKEWELLPGMTAQVEILNRIHKNVWKLPVNAKNFLLEEAYQTPEAKARFAEWEHRKDRNDWWPVWVLKDKKPWPLFVRLGGVNAKGEPGIKDALWYEVLEWDPDLKVQPDPKKPETIPDVIIGAPPAKRGFLSDLIPNIKL
jgi:multidrug efflux pump subunit AcrA (membrane-fusion protein)